MECDKLPSVEVEARVRFHSGMLLPAVALAVVAGALCLAPRLGAAQTQQQLELCSADYGREQGFFANGPTREVMMANCTAIIQSVKIADEIRAEALMTRGILYMNKSDYDRAHADFQNAVPLHPRSARALYWRARGYGLKDDYARAIAGYDEAIRLDPDRQEAWFYRGLAYRKKDDFGRAIADWTEAIRLNPKYSRAIYIRGQAYEATGDYDRAIADYDQVIRLSGEHYPYVFNSRGNAWFGKKDYDRALADYEVVLKIDPKHAVALYARGVTRKRKGIAGGDADIAAAVKLSPGVARTAEADGVK